MSIRLAFRQSRRSGVAIVIVAGVMSVAAPQQQVAVRPLGKTFARSVVMFGSIAQVRQLSDGRVLVNDVARRQVVMLDSALANPRVIIDSSGGQVNSYGPRNATIIAFVGDSTLFVDPSTQSLLVIDPAGRIARVMAIPPSPRNAAANLASRGFGVPTFHPALGLVFGARCPCPPIPLLPDGSAPVTFLKPDSSSVVAVDLTTRRVDTLASPVVGWTLTTLTSTTRTQNSNAAIFPSYDEWAMAPDGTIAVLERTFHLYWINPDRSRTPSVRLPFDWRRITEDDKVRLSDSINTVRQQRYRTALDQFIKDSTARLISPDDGGRPDQPVMVAPADFPDFMPAFARGALRADAEGNLWIRTTRPAPAVGTVVYDIVNRKSELFDRVQTPEGRTVVDFGAGGIVYLVARDGGLNILERASFK